MLKLGGWPRLTWGRVPRAPPRPGAGAPRAVRGRRGALQAGYRRHGDGIAGASTTRRARHRLRPKLRHAAPGGRGGPPSASGHPRRDPRGGGAPIWRDAQAGVPSAGWPRAQLAFKDSMARGILQFTPRIAFRYVLPRCEGRDIRCRESYRVQSGLPSAAARPPTPGPGPGRAAARPRLRAGGFFFFPWRNPRRVRVLPPPRARRSRRCAGGRAMAPERGRRGRPLRREGAFTCSRVCLIAGLGNDPSAGSPTETLLRLLLPLNDKVQWTSRDVAGGGPLASPRSEHFTGPFNR